MTIATDVAATFMKHFSAVPAQITQAPGRVNLIGDHTDYNDGFVLPAAINFGTYIAASPRADKTVRMIASDIADSIYTFDLQNIVSDEVETWSNYVKGALKYLLASGAEFSGADLVIAGNIPQGAGLSSSASLEVAVIHSFCQLYDIEISGINAALLAQKAENEFVGCNCGVMDQLISALGQADNAMLLDCQNLQYSYTSIPEQLAIVVIDSGVKRGLVDSEYNLRRAQCDEAAAICGESSLRTVDMKKLAQHQSKLSPVLYRRALHVISENERTVAAHQALKNNDVAHLSELMRQSHLSLKDDFNVSTPQIDFLVDTIHRKIGDNGGVRMTGGGFGGCVVCLVPKAMLDDVTSLVREQYIDHTGLNATVFECYATDGPFLKTAISTANKELV